MDVIYAETIHSFADDLDNLRAYKNKNINGDGKRGNNRVGGNCSLHRFMQSATCNYSGIFHKEPTPKTAEILSNIDRLAKTASIWTRPELSRNEADAILQEFEKGIFIVRMTTNQKTMVLSYKGDDKVQHVMIKVDVTKGFFMDGSQNIFRNVNLMISHYMTHALQNPDLILKLPRALREASEPIHFKFFENLKLDFWKTSLANKGIRDIWPANKNTESKEKQTPESDSSTYTDSNPPLPPRLYMLNDLSIIQGLADAIDTNESIYNKINKAEKENSLPSPIKNRIPSLSESERAYSQLWNWSSDQKPNVEQIPSTYENKASVIKSADSNFPQNKVMTLPDRNKKSVAGMRRKSKEKPRKSKDEDYPLIRNLIETYYPQIVKTNYQCSKDKMKNPSLTDDIMKIKERFHSPKPDSKQISEYDISSISECQYETPWDVQAPWITKLMNMDSRDLEDQTQLMSEMVKASHHEMSSESNYQLNSSSDDKSDDKKDKNWDTLSSVSYTDDDDDDDNDNNYTYGAEDYNLKQELLAEIQPVMLSSTSTYSVYSTKKFKYGESIRNYLIQLCSNKGTSDISNSIRMFIQCTIERVDLSPYTTMRLIRQYMSGLKNLIKQQQSESPFNTVIDEERKRTPTNVFINLDSIMESVLTKVVVKPLMSYVYRLLVLEHYKNNNLNLIADGVEVAKNIQAEKLGLESSSIEIIDSKIEIIKKKFMSVSRTYSPEKKIGHFISIIEIVFQMVKIIYPGIYSDSKRIDIKTDKLLSILVYIFSQCKKDAISTQCEVEYIEGVIWSSSLVNGEPGFYLMNLMSSLEAIKVFSRPDVRLNDFIDLANNDPTVVSNSSFFKKIKPSTIAAAAIGSVSVIILDEKINRLVTKTFPVRSTINARTLCNSISHRLGIFNPMEYNLFKLIGTEDILLQDFEIPLTIKQAHQQTTGETLNFLFKRKNATFILPSDI